MMGSRVGRVAIVAFGMEHCKRGVEAHGRMLFEKLLQEGVDVVLIKGSGYQSERELVLSVPKRHTLLNRFLGRLRGYNVYWEQVFFMIRLAWHLLRKHDRYDVIYTQEYVHLIGMGRLKRLADWRFRLIYCEGFVTDSITRVQYADALQEINKQNYNTIRSVAEGLKVPVQLIPHFFDPIWDEMPKETVVLDEIKRFKGDTNLLLYVGPTELAEKNFQRIEKDFARLDSSWKLLICGDVPEERLNRMNAEKERVMSVYVSHALMQRIYPLADIFVLPSTNEAFGIATIEAMGHGVPVLLHNSDHSLWLCGDQNQCVDMRVEGAMLKHIGQIENLPTYRSTVGARNQRHFMESFTWERLKEDYLALLAT